MCRKRRGKKKVIQIRLASSWTVWGELPFWECPKCSPSDAAFSCNELSKSSGSWWSAIFSMAMRHLRCSFTCNCLVPSAWGSEWFNAGLQLWLPELDSTSTRRGRTRTHTRTTGHLALLSIVAATCFINQTNLEVINCPRQIDTRMETHVERTCTCTCGNMHMHTGAGRLRRQLYSLKGSESQFPR